MMPDSRYTEYEVWLIIRIKREQSWVESAAKRELLKSYSFLSRLPEETTVSHSGSFIQYFSDDELDQIRQWIADAMREFLGCKDD